MVQEDGLQDGQVKAYAHVATPPRLGHPPRRTPPSGTGGQGESMRLTSPSGMSLSLLKHWRVSCLCSSTLIVTLLPTSKSQSFAMQLVLMFPKESTQHKAGRRDPGKNTTGSEAVGASGTIPLTRHQKHHGGGGAGRRRGTTGGHVWDMVEAAARGEQPAPHELGGEEREEVEGSKLGRDDVLLLASAEGSEHARG